MSIHPLYIWIPTLALQVAYLIHASRRPLRKNEQATDRLMTTTGALLFFAAGDLLVFLATFAWRHMHR